MPVNSGFGKGGGGMLNARSLGLSIGILWAVVLFLMTVLSLYTGYAAGFLEMMAGVYPGFRLSWPGAFIGLVMGFIDGFIGGYLVAWLYNRFNR
jgi:hypothetical protein